MTKLRHLVDHKTGVSLRRLGSKFEVHDQTIPRNLKDMNLNYYEKWGEPKYNDKKLHEYPIRARRLYRLLRNKKVELMMDNKKYFTLTNESTSTNRGFDSSQRSWNTIWYKTWTNQKIWTESFSLDSYVTKRNLITIFCNTETDHQWKYLSKQMSYTTSDTIVKSCLSSEEERYFLAWSCFKSLQ